MFGCSLDKRVHPLELKFLLDQRSESKMVIGSLDLAATEYNVNIEENKRTQIKADIINSMASSSNDLLN